MSAPSPQHLKNYDKYIRKNPRRVPDWRWQGANCIAKKGGAGSLDITIWRVADFLRGGTHWIADPKGKYRYSIRPLLAIHHDRYRRLALESRLLAYRDPEFVAKACDLKEVTTVVDYCRLFFDVLDRLHLHNAIKERVIEQRSPYDYVRNDLYRVAYIHGPVVLEHRLEHLPYLAQLVDHDLKTLEGIERERLELLLAHSHKDVHWNEPKSTGAFHRLVESQPVGMPFYDLIAEYQVHALQQLLRSAPAEAENAATIMRRAA